MLGSMNQQSGVRFTLKKRTIRNSLDDVNISSYNSDFLSGLFADVAKVTEMVGASSVKRSLPFRETQATNCELSSRESPMKKQRTLRSSSMNRCKYSSYNLSQLDSHHSPKLVNEEPNHVIASPPKLDFIAPSQEERLQTAIQSGQVDSLAFQLDCVGGSESSTLSTNAAAVVAFPNLPATVSDSSCTAGLTRGIQIKHGSSPEKQQQHKESFGWFVDLDDQQHKKGQTIASYSFNCSDLAFQAPTAPHASHNDAEVQWAKAADTVDDVLADFF